MNKLEKAKVLLGLGFSRRQTARELGVNKDTIAYWLDHPNVTLNIRSSVKDGEEIICRDCGRKYTKERRKGHKGDVCNSCATNKQQERNRGVIRNIIGEKCVKCGYEGCAIDYHHVNKKDKLFSLGGGVRRFGTEKIQKEAKKCIPFCANCHREFHEGLFEYKDLILSCLKDYQKELILSCGGTQQTRLPFSVVLETPNK